MFSTIIPVYNHAPYLARAVASALRSRLVDEVLLVDDGSTDASRSEIERLCALHSARVRALLDDEHANRGAGARLNQLVAAARSDWLAVLNSDDMFVAGRFEALRMLLRRWRDVDFFWGHLLVIDGAGGFVGTKRGVLEPEYPFPARLPVRDLLAANSLATILANQNVVATTSNMVFTRSLHRRIGGFSDDRYVHDWDFALRAAAVGRTCFTPRYLTAYRSHSGNTIKRAEEATQREAEALFGRFAQDYPEIAAQDAYRRALAGNRHLGAGAAAPGAGGHRQAVTRH